MSNPARAERLGKYDKYAVSSIQPIDRALSGATTLGQSGPGSNGNEGVLCIPQGPSITGTSPKEREITMRKRERKIKSQAEDQAEIHFK